MLAFFLLPAIAVLLGVVTEHHATQTIKGIGMAHICS